MNSRFKEIYKWQEADDSYQSSSSENQAIAAEHSLGGKHLFILDLLDNWIMMMDDEDQKEQIVQFKKELIEDLDQGENKIKGAL